MKLGQTDYLPRELVILTKFHENRTKIVDFFTNSDLFGQLQIFMITL